MKATNSAAVNGHELVEEDVWAKRRPAE